MKFTSRTVLALAALAAFWSPVSAQQTKILTADKHNEYGLVYTLPVTALDIEVTAVREVRQGGPFYKYAKKYVGTSTVIAEDSESWTLESVKVRPYGVADPKNRYLMQLKPGSAAFIGVDGDGMILSINANPESPIEFPRDVQTVKDGDALGKEEYLKYVDQDFVSSQSDARRAQMLAESLMEIRDSKISLTRGTAETMPADGKQLELMLNSLAHQEAALTAAFTGSASRETVTRHYTYIPRDAGGETLFRLSDFAGFVAADDFSGEPVYVSVDITNRGQLPVDAKGEVKKLPKDAVAYKVPGEATVKVTYKGEVYYSGDFEFGQFGVVFGLNPMLFSDRKEPSYAVFDPATGALKEIGAAKELTEE